MIPALTLALALASGASGADAAAGVPLVHVRGPSIEVEARLCERPDHKFGVVDGDTLDVVVTRLVDGRHDEATCAACAALQRQDRKVHGDTQLRLGGGFNAPEWDEPGGRETRALLRALLGPGSTLYLDVDDGARGCPEHKHPGRDPHCRLLAKVYVRDGETYVDVHATLVAWGQARFPQHDWLRYARKPSEFGSPKP